MSNESESLRYALPKNKIHQTKQVLDHSCKTIDNQRGICILEFPPKSTRQCD